MQKRIIVFLHSIEPLLASWVVLDDNGNIIESVSEAPLTNPSPPEGETECLVIVPAEDVLLTQVNLPKLNRQRLMQALPFALEEQLLDELENLHFAVGPYLTDNSLAVAVISKQKMDLWISTLKSIGIAASAMIPLTFTLPTEENTWFINTHNNLCIVRSGKYSGFTSEVDNLSTLLDLKLKEEKDKESIQMVRSKLSELQLIEDFSKQASRELPIDLLQGDYRAKRQTTHTKKIWLLAGYLAAAWIGLAFFSNLISFFILHHQASNIESSIKQIYKHNFPQATAVVSPRKRMEDKLKSIFNEAQKNNFLALLGLISKSISTSTGIHLQNLEFREKRLTLEISANTFDNLDAFTENLTQQGLNVKRQNAAIAGTQVKANLLINAGES